MNYQLKLRKDFQPDFQNLVDVLERKTPKRATLFEFMLNTRLIEKLSGVEGFSSLELTQQFHKIITAFANAGYDYTTISGWRTNTLNFPKPETEKKESISLNAHKIIYDRNSFEKYAWPNAEDGDYDIFYNLKKHLPDGMKLIASGNGGVLENVIDLVGFENLCMMVLEDEDLVTDIFDAVGSRFLSYYEIVAPIETIGACIVNDDWGFKNQTMLSPEMLRRWVFPWHKKIVNAIHNSGKYAILHSCGNLCDVMNDVIDMKYDAKHSFEDVIMPVEDFYKRYSPHISILGGVDVNFLAKESVAEIKTRSKNLLNTTKEKGGYALGSGNSIPEYIPDENYFAMISAVFEED